ncbi:MAG: hypothetical protein WBQ60_10430 [Asticcacaulis sp.]
MDILAVEPDDLPLTVEDLDAKVPVETRTRGLPLMTMAISGLAGIGLFALIFTTKHMFQPNKVVLK